MSEQTYHVQLTVTVERETDLAHFQPGSWCATLAGTDWKWVGETPREAVRCLIDWALRGGYRDHGYPQELAYTVEEAGVADDALATLQSALHSMLFSRKRYCYIELQRRASAANRICDDGSQIAWPDVLLYLTPEIIRDSIQAAQDATHEDISARLGGERPC